MKTVAATLTALAMVSFPIGSAKAADEFPTKQITITNIYAVGGGVDLVARAVAYKLSEKWKVPVVVESKPGAGGTIAAAYVARQPADGYSLLVTDVSFSIVPSIYKKLAYDPMKDLQPVILMTSVTQALTISPTLPVNTVAELVDYTKKNSGKLAYASAGVGSLPHLGMELFKKTAGVDILHVPYRGAVPAFTDVMGGQAQMYMGALATPLPQINDGKLKGIAVMQKHRSPLLPNVPSIVEAGYPDLDFNAYYGLFAPAGTPRPVVDKLVAAIREALQTPELQKLMRDLACESVGSGPEEFKAFLKQDVDRWQKASEIAGITPNN